jgi:hypothetical protein
MHTILNPTSGQGHWLDEIFDKCWWCGTFRMSCNGLVIPSWLASCWIAQGSGFESQRGHLFFGISPRGEISQEGFSQGLVSPPATSRYIGSVRIISEAPLVCPNGC